MSYYNYIPHIVRYFGLLISAKYKKKIVFAVEGGLGDLMTATQFVNHFKEKWPDCYVVVYCKDDNVKASPDDFSWGRTRKYRTSDGGLANPSLEWIKNFDKVDEIIGLEQEIFGCDFDDVDVISFHPTYVGAYRGFMPVAKFKTQYLDHKLLSLQLSPTAADVLQSILIHKESFGKKIVTLHLRRNAEHIIEFAAFLQTHFSNLFFIFLGSTEHQNIPSIPSNLNGISLIDSYETQGINTVEVLRISSECDLFIGGRGGFEIFHYLNKKPSINFFDEHGEVEICALIFPPSFFKENPFGRPYDDKEPFSKILEKINTTGLLNE